MVDSDGKISTIIVTSEFRSRHLSLLESAGFRDRLLEGCLFLESAGDATSNALWLGVLGERSREGEFVVGLMLHLF